MNTPLALINNKIIRKVLNNYEIRMMNEHLFNYRISNIFGIGQLGTFTQEVHFLKNEGITLYTRVLKG